MKSWVFIVFGFDGLGIGLPFFTKKEARKALKAYGAYRIAKVYSDSFFGLDNMIFNKKFR